jgi:hypothetical protein
MTENWFSILSQLAIGLAWPVAILALAFLFRKAIRPRFKEVREVKNPDGSTTMDGSDLSENIAKSRKDEIKRS